MRKRLKVMKIGTQPKNIEENKQLTIEKEKNIQTDIQTELLLPTPL